MSRETGLETTDMEPLLIDGVLRGVEGETRQICWERTVCGWKSSDDYDPGVTNPLMTLCGHRRQRPSGNDIAILVQWRPEVMNR